MKERGMLVHGCEGLARWRRRARVMWVVAVS
jgi:hypothetical protein